MARSVLIELRVIEQSDGGPLRDDCALRIPRVPSCLHRFLATFKDDSLPNFCEPVLSLPGPGL